MNRDKKIALANSLNRRNLLNWMPDKMYIKMLYKVRMGRKLNLNNPQTFNEKLQWLKLYDRKPEYTTMVDKAAVKDYVAEKIGSEYIIPTLGVWEHFDDIDFDQLPNQFVLKCNHDSGGLVICKDKASLDMDAAREKIESSLKRSFYYHSREWPYKNVKPRIIAEKYMVDESGTELKDYKFYCFAGKAEAVMINSDRNADEPTKADYFDRDYNWLDFTWGYSHAPVPPRKPEKFDEMIRIAELLSNGLPHARIDLYSCNGQIYFGEITFFDGSGFDAITPVEWDYKLGSMITLPDKTI